MAEYVHTPLIRNLMRELTRVAVQNVFEASQQHAGLMVKGFSL
jgi:hypothetical protein